jgi:parallel beta-helix repeat protein
MKRYILSCLSILLFIQTLSPATIRYVPTRTYPTIQSAINSAASTGDVIIVKPGTYTPSDGAGFDFGNKALILRSQINPDNPDPDIIAKTIIDCRGTSDNPRRAFHFHNGQHANSQIIGFTIINGYARGPIALGTDIPGPLICNNDPATCPPAANGGNSATGNGYGGAIFCENTSSPTIKYCVISDCTVTGAQGSKGANGINGPWIYTTWEEQPDPVDPNLTILVPTPHPTQNGQWGGIGGNGTGNGYGGAVACVGGSNPTIINCTIKNNAARGGQGGRGGNGGHGTTIDGINYTGQESYGGDGGNGIGDGMGGGIYASGSSNPIVQKCVFINDIATTGVRALGGDRGEGTEIDVQFNPPATDGDPGYLFSTGFIAGGAAYHGHPSNASYAECKFIDNKAYEVDPSPWYVMFTSQENPLYTVGGALYSQNSDSTDLDDGEFTGNLGGAVYCGSGSTVDINDCLFSNNSETANGGALYIGSSCPVKAKLQGCTFGGNSAVNDGGALKCLGNLNLKKCSFSGNQAQEYGGAIDLYAGATLTLDANSCIFSNNKGKYGGAFSSEEPNATFTNCYFLDNTADTGGGLDIVLGGISIIGGLIKGNSATGTDGSGGGLSCMDMDSRVLIRDCTIRNNSATGYGGAADLYGGTGLQKFINCLITDNTASKNGGAISVGMFNEPQISSCTFTGNTTAGLGGAIFSNWSSSPQITDCIFENCNNHAIHEEDYGGNAIVIYSLFYGNPDGEYYDSVTHLVYGPGQVGSIPGGVANLYGDPLFAVGSLGDYYLSQTAAGQGSNSPAINNGSGTAVSLGLNTYTTRTDNVGDAGQVDRGYHYRKSTEVGTFQLTTSVVGGQGQIEATSPAWIAYNPVTGTYSYYAGTLVALTATPASGWRVENWSGADNLGSVTNNTVVMNSNKNVTVKFKQPKTLIVAVGGGAGGFYANIQDALHDANDGDTIIVYPGVYYGGDNIYLCLVHINKSVEIRSLSPEDPTCVASTILDGYRNYQNPLSGWAYDGVFFSSDATLNGLTIQNCGGYAGTGLPGTRQNPIHPDGWGGGCGSGAAMGVYTGVSATIKNCIIRDNLVLGGNGGNGIGASLTQNAGRGGWGGFAWGGAIYCYPSSKAEFINCQILNNEARGGVGGNGGNAVVPGGQANYGGNWSMAEAYNYDPYSLSMTFVQGDLWEYWSPLMLAAGEYYPYAYIGDYRWYSGYGGGVFCDKESTVTFTNCEIRGNLALGGVSGRGGLQAPLPRPMEPLIPFRLPSFGGGVYCAAGSNVEFISCTIADNNSSDPNQTVHHRDPYPGHGGGVCAEDTALVRFSNCNFSGNVSSVGGGLHFANANPVITDCNFVSNRAFQGGGLFGENGQVDIIRCDIGNNNAFLINYVEPNRSSIMEGYGGGIHLWATDANIVDSYIHNNYASYSGGGAYFGGENSQSLKNCLITKNTADESGGGVSAGTLAQLSVSNCTITDNNVPGSGYGGGIYGSYESYTNIINSILWGNYAEYGPAIAVATNLSPSTVKVTYSDVQDGRADVYFDAGCIVNWGLGNIDSDPLFVSGVLGDFYLSQPTSMDSSVVTSPAINAGSDQSTVFGLDKYTTCIDGRFDAGDPNNPSDPNWIVDMGYHYPATGSLEIFNLQVNVNGGHGTFSINPAGKDNGGGNHSYFKGTLVTITAVPDAGWRVKSWSGTNNDSSTNKINTVIMDSNKTEPPVTIEFEEPRTVTVPGEYSSIQQAFDASKDGDIILVGTGLYRTSTGYNLMGKNVTITSENPDDPNVVAATVIELRFGESGYIDGRAFTFANVGPETVLNGITLRNFTSQAYSGIPGRQAGDPGYNGMHAFGGAIVCYGSSPTIKNCRFVNCQALGGNGGNGAVGADPNINGGDGGWPGKAYGGAIACLPILDPAYGDLYGTVSSPTIVNCTFQNCSVTGGNGGDGGNGGGSDPVFGWAGRGGGWYYGEGSPWYYNNQPWRRSNQDEFRDGPKTNSYYDYYTKYSGLGGAIYVGKECQPTITNCTFIGNRCIGGTCGITGLDGWLPNHRSEPSIRWKIDTFGGAVYCDADSSVVLQGCMFEDNIADNNMPVNNDDPFVSLGGAVAAEDGATVTIKNCTFNRNLAAVGGGVYGANTTLQISDSNLSANRAYNGGGLYCVDSNAILKDSKIARNSTNIEVDDANFTGILGNGGGIYTSLTNAQIIDSTIVGNYTKKSGAGVYLSGSKSSVFNCLFTGNEAGRDGGGISANWYANLTIRNCTIADNNAIGSVNGVEGIGLGGGLSCSYDSNSIVIDSIFWNNDANDAGAEIAVSSGFEFDPRPSRVNVSYSDIKGGRDLVFVDEGCTLNWLTHNMDINPLFVTGPSGGNYYLSQVATGWLGQTTNSPCLDAGNITADAAGLSDGYTTRTDDTPDKAIVDLGYHYPINNLVAGCKVCDMVSDGIIDFADFAEFAENWLVRSCSPGNGWCNGADLNTDGTVNMQDLSMFVDCWLTIAVPYPNPAQWAVEPHAVSITSVSMTVQTAYDSWIGNVEYSFDCITPGGHDSGWVSSTSYTDSGLTPDTIYGYRVKARNGIGHETEWSVVSYIHLTPDTTPPVTNPMLAAPDRYISTWSVLPVGLTSSSIRMAATTAYDSSGVEYYFQCTAGGTDPNLYSSDWQDSNEYTATGLQHDVTYTFRVIARDKAAIPNVGFYSVTASATPANVDLVPPTIPADLIQGVPYRHDDGAGNYYDHIEILVTNVTDDVSTHADMWINFECLTAPYNSEGTSGWVHMQGTGSIAAGSSHWGTVTYNGDNVAYDGWIWMAPPSEARQWHVRIRDAAGRISNSNTITINP